MTEPKSSYVFPSEVEEQTERFEINCNYHVWSAAVNKPDPIYLEILDENLELAADLGSQISMSISQGNQIIAALTEIIDYLEEKND